MMRKGVEAYYRHEHGDSPLAVHTPDGMDRLVDELLAEDWEHRSAAVYHMDRPLTARNLPDHELYICVDPDTNTGALRYLGDWEGQAGTWFSKGDSGRTGTVLHYYMGSDNEYPADSAIPLDLVRAAAREFLRSGGQRPTGVTWQPHWANEPG